MWMLGITNSYTMEASFGGSSLGSRNGTHFTTAVCIRVCANMNRNLFRILEKCTICYRCESIEEACSVLGSFSGLNIV